MIDRSIVSGESMRGSELVHERCGRIIDDVPESLIFHNNDHHIVEDDRREFAYQLWWGPKNSKRLRPRLERLETPYSALGGTAICDLLMKVSESDGM
jgi:hypothetical protein